MVELRDLREALDTAQWPANRDAQWHRAQDVIRAAARRFLALTETGQRVEWCVTHGCSVLLDESHRGGVYETEHCAHGEWVVAEVPEGDGWDCVVVSEVPNQRRRAIDYEAARNQQAARFLTAGQVYQIVDAALADYLTEEE